MSTGKGAFLQIVHTSPAQSGEKTAVLADFCENCRPDKRGNPRSRRRAFRRRRTDAVRQPDKTLKRQGWKRLCRPIVRNAADFILWRAEKNTPGYCLANRVRRSRSFGRRDERRAPATVAKGANQGRRPRRRRPCIGQFRKASGSERIGCRPIGRAAIPSFRSYYILRSPPEKDVGCKRSERPQSVRLREGFRTANRCFTQYRGFRQKGLLRRSRRRTHPLKRDSSERRLFPYIQELIWVSPLPAVPNSDNTPYPQRWKPIIPPRWDGFKRRRMYLYVSVCVCMCLQEVNEAFPLGSPNGGRGRICGTGIGASPCGGRTPSAPLLVFFGRRGGLNIFTGRWARRLFLFLTYILYCYILSAIFILFYPYYPLQPAGKLRRFRMCGINLRAVCIGGRPCRAVGTA